MSYSDPSSAIADFVLTSFEQSRNTELWQAVHQAARAQGLTFLYNTCLRADNALQVYEWAFAGRAQDAALWRQTLFDLCERYRADLAWQPLRLARSHKRLAFFDMDSTLIQCECIDELAKRAGVGAQVAAVTERAMRGDIPFEQSFRERLATLDGLPESVLAEIGANLPITPGMPELIATLKAIGCRVCIVSGGFTYFTAILKDRYGFDHMLANELEIIAGHLTGKHIGHIIDGEAKARCVRETAAQFGIAKEQIMAIGDGANDLAMMAEAGLGVAFHAKPKVRQQADCQITTTGLDGIAHLLGLSVKSFASTEK